MRCILRLAIVVALFIFSLPLKADITVLTFEDFNNNGIRENGEPLISGLQVTGYDESGNELPFLDDGQGTFILPAIVLSGRVRIVVTGYHDQLLAGKNRPTSVFFAVDGDNITVPVLLELPVDPNSSNILIPCYEKGASQLRKDSPAFVRFPFSARGIATQLGGTGPDPIKDASISEIGSTWGVTYQRSHQRAFTATLLKRHVGVGPQGLDAIYTLNYQSGNPEINYFNLQGMTPSAGPPIDLGSVRREIVDVEIDHTMPYALSTIEDRVRRGSYDTDAFDKVGKTAFGDIEMGEDGRTLWMINLHQRSLISLDVGNQVIEPTAAFLKHYPMDDIPGLPNLFFRYRQCINAGGNSNLNGSEAFTDANEVAWDKNKHSVGGSFGYINFAVQNLLNEQDLTSGSDLYQTFRRGDFTYDIPVPVDESYEIRLHFAEPENLIEGDRLFDILLGDEVLVENFDIVKFAGGAMKAAVLKLNADSRNGRIQLRFVSKFGTKRKEALLAGLEVIGQTITESGVLRPWALAFHQGRGYVGVISDASYSQSREHLFAYLLSFDPSDVLAGFTEELAFPLGYPRERASNAHLSIPQPLRSAAWEPWVATWEETMIPTQGEALSIQGGLLCAYAQPILSEISFTPDGSIVLGLMDRWAHQTGHLNYTTTLSDRTLLIGYAAGDILKVFREPDGQYVLEKTNSDDGLYYRNDDGPSYQGEFFFEENFISPLAHHGEIYTGGQALIPGMNLVAATVHSPILTQNPSFQFDGLLTQGLHFYDYNTGRRVGAYLFVEQFIQGKANGLGDIVIMVDAAPPSVGNYVWCDANGNGVQDPSEFGIDGIRISLHDGEEGLIELDHRITSNAGQYFFDNLLPSHHYQLRIDLDELKSMGFSGGVSPLHTTDSLFDSDADDISLPGYAVIDFISTNDGFNRDDLDFGFLGPEALDALKVLCEDVNIPPLDQPCADFALSDIRDCVTNTLNTTISIFPSVADAEEFTNEIISDIRVCGMDSVVFSRVAIAGDPNCYAISEIHLMVQPGAGGLIVDFVELICPTDFFNALDYLQDQGFRGDASTEFFVDPGHMIVFTGDPSQVDPATFPFTLYYDDTIVDGGCGVPGSITLTAIPETSIFAGRDTSLCGLDCIDLTLLGATFSANGTGAEEAVWSTSGTGRFVDDTTFAGAHFYCPDEGDLALGRVILTLTVVDDPCVTPPPSSSVEITLTAGTPSFLPHSRDTIDCYHPFATDPAAFDTFPGCRLVIECIDTLIGVVIDYEILIGDCTDIIKEIKRTLRFVYNNQEFFCMDTISVRALPDTLICPPMMDSVYCVPGYQRDENGHPSPLETGFPTAGGIPLWPQLPALCDILVHYKDVVFGGQCPITIRRDWIIKNSCTGSLDLCSQWLMIFDTTAPIITKLDTAAFIIPLPTGSHDCFADAYVPPIMVEDTCTGVKMVKAMVNNQIVVLTLNEITGYYESHTKIRLPVSVMDFQNQENVISYVSYEVIDHCHNKTILDSLPLLVVDATKPVAVCDKGLNVTVTDSLIWVPASAFDEGSWDNCGVALILARRADWATACGVDLCDDIELINLGSHHDSVFFARLESEKHVNEVEAHYQKVIDWLCLDGRPCSYPFLLGWVYDLIKYGTLVCSDHPYPVSDTYVDDILNNLSGDDPYGSLLTAVIPCLNPLTDTAIFLQIAEFFGTHNEIIQTLFNDLSTIVLANNLQSVEALTDIGKHIGGGWSTEVPFCCEDACKNITVEVLVMDYWCNWSKCWTTVYVEDKTPPKVTADLYDVTISCAAYNSFYADAVEMALNGEFDDLQHALGGYDKVYFDPYGNVGSQTGFSVYDLKYDSNLVVKDSLVFDEHLGYIWKPFSYYRTEYDTLVFSRFNGQVADNCGLQCIEEKPWVSLDNCGAGFVKRVFKFVGQCSSSMKGHPADTITRTQTIWITPNSDLSEAMFEVPRDTIIHSCSIVYSSDGSGQVASLASPNITGWGHFRFNDQCRQLGIGYYDKVFKIVGGDQGCYKILRTWCFADWCSIGSQSPGKEWWWDPQYEGKFLTSTQKIIVFDEEPAICRIDLPSEIRTSACLYTLDTDIYVENECGTVYYTWNLTNNKIAGIFRSGHGQHDSHISGSFRLRATDLPEGTYSLKLVLIDECQNESQCEQVFTVIGEKKPTPVCLSSLTLDLTPMDLNLDGIIDTAMAVIWAKEFDQSSFASCGSSAGDLAFRIDMDEGAPLLPPSTSTYLELGCNHLGAHQVRVYVLDQNGNWDYCSAILIIQNNAGGCSNPGSAGDGVVGGISSNEYHQYVKPLDINSELIKSEDRRGQVVLFQNRPNPFHSETNIGFSVPRGTHVQLTIFDISGRTLKSIQGMAHEGYNEWLINDLPPALSSGLLYYRLETADQTIVKKMVFLNSRQGHYNSLIRF